MGIEIDNADIRLPTLLFYTVKLTLEMPEGCLMAASQHYREKIQIQQLLHGFSQHALAFLHGNFLAQYVSCIIYFNLF